MPHRLRAGDNLATLNGSSAAGAIAARPVDLAGCVVASPGAAPTGSAPTPGTVSRASTAEPISVACSGFSEQIITAGPSTPIEVSR